MVEIDSKKIEELRGLLAADTSTDWQTVRTDPAEGADVWWLCAKNSAGQEIELGSLQGGFPHPTREARARLICAMRNALPALLDLATASLEREGEDGDSLASQVVREVAELPDRSSPDDMPDMMMVTAQELHDIVAAVEAARIRALTAENEVLRRERDEGKLSSAFALIQTERIRQIEEEGWTPEHDDTHDDGEMLSAAVIYLWWGTDRAAQIDPATGAPHGWRWDRKWWKPKHRLANLARAGALCMAEAARRKRRGLHSDPADHKLRLCVRELADLLGSATPASAESSEALVAELREKVKRLESELQRTKSAEPDWYWCEIDPDESGDSAYQAMHSFRLRLDPVELGTSYVGPKLWGVMSPPLPDAEDDEETAHTFATREEAQAFCDERNAIFNGAALCPADEARRARSELEGR